MILLLCYIKFLMWNYKKILLILHFCTQGKFEKTEKIKCNLLLFKVELLRIKSLLSVCQ